MENIFVLKSRIFIRGNIMMNHLLASFSTKTRRAFALILSLGFMTCSDAGNESGLYVELDPQLDVDQNGYFHMELLRDTWQTTHRISGFVTFDGEAVELVRIEWTSSHFWRLNDTLGFYIDYGYTDELKYIALDTIYITGFDEYVVPTINCCSYSNAEGEINTMIAPVRSMIGDTMIVGLQYSDGDPIGEIFIVLD
jgi:hypothetical protein